MHYGVIVNVIFALWGAPAPVATVVIVHCPNGPVCLPPQPVMPRSTARKDSVKAIPATTVRIVPVPGAHTFLSPFLRRPLPEKTAINPNGDNIPKTAT
jgi:hypothetical protein